MPGKPKIESLNAKLNIVLKPEQITEILRKVLGPSGKAGSVFLASDHCCVDGSVGSSVAGPVSSVASSVSYPDPGRVMGGRIIRKASKKTKVTKKAKGGEISANIKIPKGLKVK